jgi:hypothetical protein
MQKAQVLEVLKTTVRESKVAQLSNIKINRNYITYQKKCILCAAGEKMMSKLDAKNTVVNLSKISS